MLFYVYEPQVCNYKGLNDKPDNWPIKLIGWYKNKKNIEVGDVVKVSLTFQSCDKHSTTQAGSLGILDSFFHNTLDCVLSNFTAMFIMV